MIITLNGSTEQVPELCTASQLVAELGLTDKRIALEVNREIIPRSEYSQYRLASGDEVEIVSAVGGG